MGQSITGMQANSTDPYNIKITKKVNEPNVITFSILKTGNEYNANYRISEVIDYGGYIYLVDTVKDNLGDYGIVTLDVTAIQNSINLSRMLISKKQFKNTSVTDIINYVLQNTGWSLGDNDIDASVTLDYDINDKETVSKVLLDIADKIDAVLIYERDTVTLFRNKGEVLPINSDYNVLSVNSSSDTGDIITRVYGYGANDSSGDPIQITQVNPTGLPYVENYSYFLSLGYSSEYIKANPSIFVREGKYEDSSITSQEVLLSKTREYLERYCKPSVNCNLVLSMPDITSCDNIKLNMRRNIYDDQSDQYIPCRVIQIDQELNDELTVNIVLKSEHKYGDYLSNIVTKIEKVDKKVEYVWENIVDGTIQEVSQLIKNGINGYVVVNENEILIMDTKDKNTATYVARWNSGGLGFSSNGYNGEYSTAMTKDGSIVADRITTGNLNARLIKLGVLQSLNGKTWINMEDGTFSLADGAISYDGSTFHIDKATKVNPNLIWDGTFLFGANYWSIEGEEAIYEYQRPSCSWIPSGEGIALDGHYFGYRDSYVGITSNKIVIDLNQKYTLSFLYLVERNVKESLVYAYLYDEDRNYIGADLLASLGTSTQSIESKYTVVYTPNNVNAKYVAIHMRNRGLTHDTGSYKCVFFNKIKFEFGGEATEYIGSEIALNNYELKTTLSAQLDSYCTQSQMEQYADGVGFSVKTEVGNIYATKSELQASTDNIYAAVSTELDGYMTKSEAELTATQLALEFSSSTVNIIEDGGFETRCSSISDARESSLNFLSSIDGVPTIDGGLCAFVSGTTDDCYLTLDDRVFSLESNTTYTISGYTRGASAGGYIISSAYLTNGTDYIPVFPGENLSTGNSWEYRNNTFTTGTMSKHSFKLRLGWKQSDGRRRYAWAAFDAMMLVKGKTPMPFNDGNGYYDTDITIGKNGIRCTYTDGIYTEMSPKGFKYYEAGSGYSYCSLITYGVCTVYPTCNDAVGSVTITLPSVFKNKDLSTVISFNQVDLPVLEAGGNSYYTMIGLTMGASASTDPVNGKITLYYRCGFPRGLLYEGNIAHDGYGTDTARLIINYAVFGRY